MDLQLLLEAWVHCAYCGVLVGQGEHAIDHIVPVHHGGHTVIANLALACSPCNGTKGARTADEFGHPRVAARARDIATICDLILTGVPIDDIVCVDQWLLQASERIRSLMTNWVISEGLRLPRFEAA